MSIVIAFPHTYASAEIGRQALACCYDVQLYMPLQIDREWGDHILTDLSALAARSGLNKVQMQPNADFSDPDVKALFFPSLGEYNIKPGFHTIIYYIMSCSCQVHSLK